MSFSRAGKQRKLHQHKHSCEEKLLSLILAKSFANIFLIFSEQKISKIANLRDSRLTRKSLIHSISIKRKNAQFARNYNKLMENLV